MRYSPQPEKETDSKGIRKAYDVFKNRHTARFTSIPHTHTYYEAVLILEGHLTYETMEPAIIRLNPGDVLFCPPNVVHDSYIAENDSIMSSMVVKFSPLFLYPTETTQSDVECLVMPPVFNKPCYVFRESSEQALLLGHLIQQIYREYQEKKLGWELALRGGMTALYVHLVRLCGTVGNVPLPEEHETDEYSAQKLHRILRYLEDNYSYAISMQEVADACEMNYYQFSRFFKRVTNKKFNEYLLEMRLNHAQKKLLQGEKSISDIAMECGFEYVSYFIQKFKLKTGMTPKEYQRLYRVDMHAKESEQES